MNRIIEEQKKRIRHMYSFMYRRYKTNTLADGGSISDKPVLGPELIPDASRWFNIDNDPYWSRGAGVTISEGVCQFTNVGAWTGIMAPNFIVKGKKYKIEYTISNYVSGGISFQDGAFNVVPGASNGKFSGFYIAGGTTPGFYTGGGGTTTLQIDNISVREVLINSVTTDYLKMAQNNRMDKSICFGWLGESGSKITNGRVEKAYGLDNGGKSNFRRNLLPSTENFAVANWSHIRGTLTSSSELSPNGTTNAYKWSGSVDNGTHYLRYQLTTSNVRVTYSVYVKAAELSWFHLSSNTNVTTSRAFFNVSNGTIGASYNNASPKIENVGNGWYRCSITANVIDIAQGLYFDLQLANADNSPTFIGSSTQGLYIWGAQAEYGVNVTQYQYVLDTTNYNTNSYGINQGIEATQTTAGSRPYVTGNIATNEKLGLKNPNGGSNFMTHPTISFAANESWSVTFAVNIKGGGTLTSLFGDNGVNFHLKEYESGNLSSVLQFVTTVTANCNFNYKDSLGKIVIYSIVYSNGVLKAYKNGTLTASTSVTPTGVDFKSFLAGYTGRSSLSNYYAHIIRSQALTQAQVTAEYNFLRSVYPEIESVQIGTQTWATSNCEMAATPMGNVIQEMQANSYTQKFLYSGGVGATDFISVISGLVADCYNDAQTYSIVTGNGFTGNAQRCVISASSTQVTRSNTLYNTYLKISFKYRSNKPIYFGRTNVQVAAANTGDAVAVTAYIQYCDYVRIGLIGGVNGDWIEFDEVNVYTLGWANSQELYYYVYGITSGTVEQQTYAAVKAAAMWCHYGNSVDNGAIYGKLYNWFAVKLLQMDIDYYNAANPTNLWGWRVPTQADFQTLSTYLGGDAVSGGKLRVAGTTYWNSPNTGADNSSGFSALPNGQRIADGSFSALTNLGNITSITENSNNYLVVYPYFNVTTLFFENVSKIRGASLRLIKS